MLFSAVIGPKGQIVIPPGLRERYSLKEGTIVVFQEERGRLALEPSSFRAIYALEGSLKDFPIEAALEEERRTERNRPRA